MTAAFGIGDKYRIGVKRVLVQENRGILYFLFSGTTLQERIRRKQTHYSWLELDLDRSVQPASRGCKSFIIIIIIIRAALENAT